MAETERPKTVELVNSDYQPTKAEMEEEFKPEVPGETFAERMAFIGRTLMQPIKIRWIKKPRNRR